MLMRGRITTHFLNMLRGYAWTLPEQDLAALRQAYAAAVDCLRPSPRVLARVDKVCQGWAGAAGVVGVHKRLGTPEVAACQLSQRAPAPSEFIARKASTCLSNAAIQCESAKPLSGARASTAGRSDANGERRGQCALA